MCAVQYIQTCRKFQIFWCQGSGNSQECPWRWVPQQRKNSYICWVPKRFWLSVEKRKDVFNCFLDSKGAFFQLEQLDLSSRTRKWDFQKVSLQKLDLQLKCLQNWCLQRRIPAESNTCRTEYLQNWTPASANTCRIEYLQNWIPSYLNPCRREYLQNWIPAELKTFRYNPFKHEYLQNRIPAKSNTCRIEYLQNRIPANSPNSFSTFKSSAH